MKELLIAMIFVLAGCAVTGREFDISKADQLRPGVSTIDQATEMFGPPTSVTLSNDGQRKLLQWSYVKGQMIKGSSAHLALLFDSNNKLIRVQHRFQQ